ncbi:RICIN domain-containing protein [Paenibacillus sp.]|uniref:RICIN domain-containing protein n=1 Tax=Paenibacillus sp. TaxID=58172 RepID=UPI002D34D32B|nr:RICIN domain-containing protein [Paenibacillus sp.]HZG87971.1 RICIN domain-containing protein [Paenibacillus sp.]
MRPYLVFCRASDRSLHQEWLNRAEERNFDLYIEYYGDQEGRYSEDADYYSQAKGENKFRRFAELYRSRPELFSRYEAVWLCDDDISADQGTINRMFRMFREHQLWLAQPAITEDSYHSHWITIRNRNYSLRYTNFVEVMAPIFSQYALQQLMHTFEITTFAWIDFVWGKLLGYPADKMAVIDETVVKHTRPVGGGDLYLNKRGSALEELLQICDRFGVDFHRFQMIVYGGKTRAKGIAAISMMKNEADIIESFVRFNLQVVDHMIILDNDSIDGTYEILERLQAEGLPLTVKRNRGNDPAYSQPQHMTKLLWEAARDESFDLIVPLDGDEFLITAESGNPRTELERLPLDRITKVKWRTYVPCRGDNPDELFIPKRMEHARLDEYETFYKVIIPSRLVFSKELMLNLGNHSVTANGDAAHEEAAGLRLAHFPIRSLEQLKSKVIVGWITHVSRPDKRHDENWHWKKMYEQLLSGEIDSVEHLQQLALQYSTYYAWDDEEPKFLKRPFHSSVTRLGLRYTEKETNRALRNVARVAETLAAVYAESAGQRSSAFVPKPHARYEIANVRSGKVLDAAEASTADGAPIIQLGSHGHANQQWRFEAVESGFYRIVNCHSGKALCPPNRSTEEGERIVQWTPFEHESQHWSIKDTGADSFVLVNRFSGKALDVFAESEEDNAPVIQWHEHGRSNQRWKIIEK